MNFIITYAFVYCNYVASFPSTYNYLTFRGLLTYEILGKRKACPEQILYPMTLGQPVNQAAHSHFYVRRKSQAKDEHNEKR